MNEPGYIAPDPSTLPVAANSGSAGVAANGSYYPGMQPGAPGVAYTGFGANNKAAKFNGFVGYVSTPASLNDLAQFTTMGWVMRGSSHSARGGYFGQNDLLEFGDADTGANIEAWSSASGQIKIPYPFLDNQWGFLALVGDGTQITLYANGLPVATLPGVEATYGVSDYYFNIGGGGVFNVTGDYFMGSIDEVAIFDKALSAQQILDIYLAGNVPPWITQQPALPAREIFAGNYLSLSVVAGGNPPLSYQWRKDGTALPGQTSATLAFNGITQADSGSYDVVVSNDYGSVTSVSLALTVKPAETTVPTILYAAGNEAFNSVRVWFSEPLDPVSAQTAANYKLSGGVNVTVATLAAPAGSPGDNIVDLATSIQAPGTVYTLTVNDVKDQVMPANTIAPNTTVQFSSCIYSPGMLLFELWNGLSTTDNSLPNTLLKDPRFPDSPDVVTFTTAASTTPVFGSNTSREGYGGKMSGLIVPTTTGDYRFFLYSDDSSQLYLSMNADPAGKTLIAQETDCCDNYQEPGVPNDDGVTFPTSEAFRLEAGQKYYIEALWKEGTGGDYCHVAWREEQDGTAAGSLPTIPGQYLQVVVDPNVDMAFVTQPTDQLGTPASGSVPTTIYSQNFAEGDGGFTVVNTDPAPPGPWEYWSGATWAANGAESACSGPYNSQLNSPTNTLAQSGAVMLTFSHRYSFETPLWDAGQVRISVNGGEFTLVPAQNFLTNGYAEGNIIGNGIALGQRGFNGDSPGFDLGVFITSKVILGSFAATDRLVVQFVGAWDDCTSAFTPGWEIETVKMELLPGVVVSTFTSEAEASRRGDPVEIRYQWQRNDGAGWVDIPWATDPSMQFIPADQKDMQALYRVMVSAYGIPGKVIYSDVVRLTTTIPPPTISISKSGAGLSIAFTGTLQSAATVNGPYQNVSGATSPYVVSGPTGAAFYRSVK